MFIEIASVRKKSSDLFKCDQEQYISLVERVVCGSELSRTTREFDLSTLTSTTLFYDV